MATLFRLYGTTYQSVTFEFEAKALNEIGFRRDNEESFPAEELEQRYEHIETVEMTAEAEGDVQSETEQLLLDRLREKGQTAIAGLPDGGIAIVENERGGKDQPKPRQTIKNVVVGSENRLHFIYSVSPPLRIALYGPRG